MRRNYVLMLLFPIFLLFSSPALGQDVLELETSEEAVVESTSEEVSGEAPNAKTSEPATPEHQEAVKDLGVETLAPTQEGTYLTWVVKAVKSKNWPLLAGVILMLLLFLANKLGLKEKVNKKYIPWIGVIVSVLGSVGTMLITGILWYEAVIQGFLVGAAASGLWELLKDKLSKVPDKTDAEVSKEEEAMDGESEETPEEIPEES